MKTFKVGDLVRSSRSRSTLGIVIRHSHTQAGIRHTVQWAGIGTGQVCGSNLELVAKA